MNTNKSKLQIEKERLIRQNDDLRAFLKNLRGQNLAHLAPLVEMLGSWRYAPIQRNSGIGNSAQKVTINQSKLEERRAKQREYSARWRIKNRELLRERSRSYRQRERQRTSELKAEVERLMIEQNQLWKAFAEKLKEIGNN